MEGDRGIRSKREEMSRRKVKLIGFWASPLSLRIEWALRLKGIEYEYIEEPNPKDSPLVLRYNPHHQQIPVLLHGGKPISESSVILQYIEEAWGENPLLPEDSGERAEARFWAKFADEKCLLSVVGTFSKSGEDLEKAMKEACENLKTLEKCLKGNKFFGGETVGFLDIAAGWFAYWIPLMEEVLGMTMGDEEETPHLREWFNNFVEAPVIRDRLPPKEMLLAHLRDLRQTRVLASISGF